MTTPTQTDPRREGPALLPIPIGNDHTPVRSWDIAGWVLWSDAVDAKDRLLKLSCASDLGGLAADETAKDIALVDIALQALGQELALSLAIRAICEDVGAVTAEHLATRLLEQVYTVAADRERATQRIGR
jgi:hypothetical protein